MSDSGSVLCVGELLWDSLPAGLFLGGAPFNVACHLNALGVRVAMASRVGADRLGREALERVARRGISTELIQVDRELSTGFVKVTLDDEGIPEYEIAEPAAWDAIESSVELLRRAEGARAIMFGSLAQRGEITRGTIERLSDTAALKVFDVNLRSPHQDREVVRQSLRRADIVKLNNDELVQLGTWFDLPGGLRETTAALSETFDCQAVCVTRGREGSALWRRGNWVEHQGFHVVDVDDTVGAGDAFLASLLAGLLAGEEDRALLRRANLLGAYVASQPGAVPAYRKDAIARILARNRGGDAGAAVADPPTVPSGPACLGPADGG